MFKKTENSLRVIIEYNQESIYNKKMAEKIK